MSIEDLGHYYREYRKTPSVAGVSQEVLDTMIDAVLMERDRKRELAVAFRESHGFGIDDCACVGPLPHCQCVRRRIREELAVALAALAGIEADGARSSDRRLLVQPPESRP